MAIRFDLRHTPQSDPNQSRYPFCIVDLANNNAIVWYGDDLTEGLNEQNKLNTLNDQGIDPFNEKPKAAKPLINPHPDKTSNRVFDNWPKHLT